MQTQIKNYGWLLKQKTRIFFRSNEFKTKMNYFKASICAIIAGVLLSFIIIGANASDPLLFFSYVFRLAFHPLLKDSTLTYWAIYIVAGLAVAVGFKAGLFNIGVPGQMLLAGSMTIVLGLKNPAISQGAGVIGALFISIIAGAALATIAGALKAYFNIHEVVSTIMLNWIVWYVMKWMFMNPAHGMWNSNQNSTIDIVTTAPNFNLVLNGQLWIIPFIIAMLLLGIIVFIMNYTVLGFQIKAVGKSKNASLYAGTNVKAYTIVSMALSGALSGVLGMLYYMTQSTVLQFTTDALPVVGFDAIAVALVAFTNGFAILPIALLWGIIKTAALQATQLPDFQMSKQMGQLIFGIIIYMTAISTLFIYFKPIFWLHRWWNIQHNVEWKQEYNKYQAQIKDYQKQIKNTNKMYRIKMQELKKQGTKEEIKAYRNEINDQLTLYAGKITTLKTEICFFENLKYKEATKIGQCGLKTKYKLATFIALGSALDHFVQVKNEYLLKKQKISFLKNNYYQAVWKVKGQGKQELSQFYNLPKKELYAKLAHLQSQYADLVLKQEETIKKLRESYYPVFNQIQQKYLNDFKKLQKKEAMITKKLNQEIKALKRQQCHEMYQFRITNYQSKKKIKRELRVINRQIKGDVKVQQEVALLKQNLKLQLKEMKQQFNIEYQVMRKKHKTKMPQWKNELNQKLKHIRKVVSEDNKILKAEYHRQNATYQVQKGGKK
ncbi:ribose ABC transporter permease [Spiroplasma sp. ChiS]|uniref:ABC transporter permease subunit n=1 Tax=Spiroplasma sp. ChiS TaxID=2099885 RepID=UPI000CF8F275|nr:ribose ABC transporter permease [Spiroplasma sp. ChiS]PQP78584.1 ribose ABC transporter permease [Spiroplasma sp. ChiS]